MKWKPTKKKKKRPRSKFSKCTTKNTPKPLNHKKKRNPYEIN